MRCLQAAAEPQGVQWARPGPRLVGSSLSAPQTLRSLRSRHVTQPAGWSAHPSAAARRLEHRTSRLPSASLRALPERLQQLADEWLQQDEQPSSRQEIEQLVAAEDAAGLEERLGTRLQFGTAGLRGRMGAGGWAASPAWPVGLHDSIRSPSADPCLSPACRQGTTA